MITVKLSGEQGHALLVAARAMGVAAKEENKHKKARDAAKTIIARELEQHRQINLDELPDKEIVIVQVDGHDAIKIERKSSERLDQTALKEAHPDIASQFTGPSVASYFSVLAK